MVIVDSSALIALTKIGKLTLLKDVFCEVGIPPAVKQEVVEMGKEICAPGAWEVEAGIAAGWIHEVPLSTEARRIGAQLAHGFHLGDGESESIALACSLGLLVVLDDMDARRVAEATGARLLGTGGVLVEAAAKGCLRFAEFEELVRELGKVLWLSPDLVAEILRRGREFDR